MKMKKKIKVLSTISIETNNDSEALNERMVPL